jgi:hypothetical protein
VCVVQLSLYTAKLLFLWSRMRSFALGVLELSTAEVSPKHVDAAESRLRHLGLPDFLEALVRLSTMISLPTDEDIAEAGAADAADFLMALQRDKPRDFAHFVSTHVASPCTNAI